jgi:hypothetical protein
LIKYLRNNEIDKAKWDNCVLNSFNGNIYACSWYLDIAHEDWEGLVEEDYQRVMPLTVKTRFGISYLMQPYFVQQLGVFSKSILNPEIINEFIKNIPSHIKVIDINFNSFNSLYNNEYNIKTNNNYVLDLISDYPKLASRYTKNNKRNLKKAIKNNLIYMTGVKPELIINLFRNNRGKNIKNWNDSEYLVLQRLIYNAIHKGAGFTGGVYTERNELCAGAFFLKTKSHIIFLFSGSNDEAKSVGAMTFLIDAVIKKYSPGMRVFDFEGSNNDNLARFYKGFGAHNSTYNSLKINNLNPLVKLLLKAYKMF